ncbi:hypothetical protein LTR15_011473 [Elasticomyces elasticus]|nr:hypothetical protein LTR15_011473 [Elasticomyces elasticus]
MAIFDTPLNEEISSYLQQLSADPWKVHMILYWAARGVVTVFAYIKNPDRELKLDPRLDNVDRIYVKDCKKDEE